MSGFVKLFTQFNSTLCNLLLANALSTFATAPKRILYVERAECSVAMFTSGLPFPEPAAPTVPPVAINHGVPGLTVNCVGLSRV